MKHPGSSYHGARKRNRHKQARPHKNRPRKDQNVKRREDFRRVEEEKTLEGQVVSQATSDMREEHRRKVQAAQKRRKPSPRDKAPK